MRLFLLLALVACQPATGMLDVNVLDCEAMCWEPGQIEVPREHWGPYLDREGCDDGGFYTAYDDACISVGLMCEEARPGSDPAVGSTCCAGAVDPATLGSEPLCSRMDR